ncbi:MAG: helix-hairpin-helix domain-containing protein [Bacteroidota bacterium]
MASEFFKDGLHFSKSERNGIFVLITLCLLGFYGPNLYHRLFPKPAQHFDDFHQEWAALEPEKKVDQKFNGKSKKRRAPSLEATFSAEMLQPFDPNAISKEKLLAMQLPKRWVGNLVKYRSKGGRFRKAEDLRKIYGMTDQLFEQLKDFLRFPNSSKDAYKLAKKSTVQESKPDSLFAFDPNTASEANLQRLGLPQRVVQNIVRYREKGGKFRRKEQLKKIYGLSPADFERLAPFIHLPEPTEKQAPNLAIPSPRPSVVIDINRADESTWQQLRGIGPAYARRIVNFREKLGGFHSVEQVGETYYLPDSTFQNIQPQLRVSPIFRKLAVNQSTKKDLYSHPYLDGKEAQLIVNYRTQHGPYKDVNDLKKIGVIRKATWQKILPYISFEPSDSTSN